MLLLRRFVYEWTSRGVTSHKGQSAATATKQLLVGGKPAVVNLLLDDVNFAKQCMEISEAVKGKKLWGSNWSNPEAEEHFFGSVTKIAPTVLAREFREWIDRKARAKSVVEPRNL
jgi:hypothetical protein